MVTNSLSVLGERAMKPLPARLRWGAVTDRVMGGREREDSEEVEEEWEGEREMAEGGEAAWRTCI